VSTDLLTVERKGFRPKEFKAPSVQNRLTSEIATVPSLPTTAVKGSKTYNSTVVSVEATKSVTVTTLKTRDYLRTKTWMLPNLQIANHYSVHFEDQVVRVYYPPHLASLLLYAYHNPVSKLSKICLSTEVVRECSKKQKYPNVSDPKTDEHEEYLKLKFFILHVPQPLAIKDILSIYSLWIKSSEARLQYTLARSSPKLTFISALLVVLIYVSARSHIDYEIPTPFARKPENLMSLMLKIKPVKKGPMSWRDIFLASLAGRFDLPGYKGFLHVHNRKKKAMYIIDYGKSTVHKDLTYPFSGYLCLHEPRLCPRLIRAICIYTGKLNCTFRYTACLCYGSSVCKTLELIKTQYSNDSYYKRLEGTDIYFITPYSIKSEGLSFYYSIRKRELNFVKKHIAVNIGWDTSAIGNVGYVSAVDEDDRDLVKLRK